MQTIILQQSLNKNKKQFCSAAQPWSGRPSQPHQQKNPSNIGYEILGEHIVYSDQCSGAEHPFLHKKVNFFKLVQSYLSAWLLWHVKETCCAELRRKYRSSTKNKKISDNC